MRMMCLTPLVLAACCAFAPPIPVCAAEITGKGFPLPGTPTTMATATPAIAASPSSSAVASVSAPTASAIRQPDVPFENQPLSFPSTGERRRARSGEARSFQMPSVLPALFAVVVTCGLFCAALYFMRKYLPGHKQMFAHPAMEFLGRTHLDQRRFVSLLRVGKRIVVVGVSPDDMRTLSEITDEGEVTEIMEVARPKTESGLTMFQKLFQRNVVDLEAAQAKAEAKAKAAELEEQMSELRRRVRDIHNDERHADRAPAPVAPRHLDAVG